VWQDLGLNVVELSIDSERTRTLVEVVQGHNGGGEGGGEGRRKGQRGYVTSLYFAGASNHQRLAYWKSTLASLDSAFCISQPKLAAHDRGWTGGGRKGGGEGEEVWDGCGEGYERTLRRMGWGGWRALRTGVPGLRDEILPEIGTRGREQSGIQEWRMRGGARGVGGEEQRRMPKDVDGEQSVINAVKLLIELSAVHVVIVPCASDAALARHCCALAQFLLPPPSIASSSQSSPLGDGERQQMWGSVVVMEVAENSVLNKTLQDFDPNFRCSMAPENMQGSSASGRRQAEGREEREVLVWARGCTEGHFRWREALGMWICLSLILIAVETHVVTTNNSINTYIYYILQQGCMAARRLGLLLYVLT